MYKNMTEVAIEQSLKAEIENSLEKRYGKNPHNKIEKRIEQEWRAMKLSDTVLDVAALNEIALWLRENKHPYYNRGTAGASLILYLLQITRGNPLPPHLHNTEIGQTEFMPEYLNGFDIPHDRQSDRLIADGHNIPWQTLWGYDLEYTPDFYLDLYDDAENDLLDFLKTHWLTKLNPKAKTIKHESCIQFSTLYFVCYWKRDEFNLDFHNIPSDHSSKLFALTNWQEVLELDQFKNHESSPNIPIPSYFSELISAFGLLHSTGVYNHKVEFMINELGMLAHQITFRDDVFHYLLKHNYSKKEAWLGMEKVYRGQGLEDYTYGMMLASDSWVLSQCDEIRYLFPKAHAIEYILFRIKALQSKVKVNKSINKPF